MEWIILIVISLASIFLFGGKGGDKNIAKKTDKSYLDRVPPKPVYRNEPVDDYYYSKYTKTISLYARKGYEKFPIVGMYYRDLSMSDLGKFEGFAEPETDNEYDDFAIAIYSNKGVHLGYLPRENEELHEYILSNGGMVDAYGYVAFSENDGYYGFVCVDYNKNEI